MNQNNQNKKVYSIQTRNVFLIATKTVGFLMVFLFDKKNILTELSKLSLM